MKITIGWERDWRRGGKYWYRIGTTSNPYELRNCEGCGEQCLIKARSSGRFCSISCSREGERNPRWKGSEAEYSMKHKRIYDLRGSATYCVFGPDCEDNSKFHWAHNQGDVGTPDEYISMCVKCHSNFDRAIAWMQSDLPGCAVCHTPTNSELGVCQRTLACRHELDLRWRAANPEKSREKARRYREKKKG